MGVGGISCHRPLAGVALDSHNVVLYLFKPCRRTGKGRWKVEVGVAVCGAEGVDLHCITLEDVVVAKHLRTTVPFLVSARPLPFH